MNNVGYSKTELSILSDRELLRKARLAIQAHKEAFKNGEKVEVLSENDEVITVSSVGAKSKSALRAE